MTKFKSIMIVIISMMILTACNNEVSDISTFESESEINVETSTEPTNTPTPEPTNTPSPTPEPTPEYIEFGRYEQDGDTSNGPEPIEWQVISDEGDRLLLISRYILDCHPYDTGWEVTWETCDLRSWLNNDFINAAFDESEQNQILTVTLSNPDNEEYGTEGGNDTEDRVFCLSAEEILNDQFDCSPELSAEFTQYVVQYAEYQWNDVQIDTDWWLRSPGVNYHTACIVNHYGYVGWNSFYDTNNLSIGVRPALYLSVQ